MQTIVDGFFETAERHAGRLAVCDLERSLTYGELARRVGGVAAALSRRIDRPGPVAVLTPHDIDSPVALLGVLASGRGVIPLDADHPDARNRLIAERSGAVGVVTTSDVAARAQAMFGAGAAVLEIDSVPPGEARPAADPGAEDLAYVLYTSGSSGEPKGAFQLHGPLIADLVHSVESFGLGPHDRPALCYPPAVAAGLRAMLGGLLAGAGARLLAPVSLGSQGLVREIRSHGLTVFRSSATLFRHVADAAGEEGLPSLRLVALGGDRVDWADYHLFRKVCSHEARFASHLGATECSLYAEWVVEEAARGAGQSLPVGRAIPGYRIMLQDPDGSEVPKGDVGEFVIESARVAQGYWRDPERTAESFRPGSAPGLRTYRTGDLGRLRSDGIYEVVGRRDQQIKLRGFRIELGEIESALRACSGVKDGAVLARMGPAGAVQSLAAYVELKPGVDGLLPRHLRSMLAQRLPGHMIPADIVVVDALPWLANFKIDRQRLMAMDGPRSARSSGEPPEPVTAEVIRAYEAVLRLQGVEADDDLLGLGGDSLQAVDIALEIELRLGVRVAPEEMDSACPIGELVERLGLRRPVLPPRQAAE